MLPHGGTVTVWVGVPDDPYIDDKQPADDRRRAAARGKRRVASLSTVLDPEQVSEGDQLAREVKTALEAGEIGLHADDLEPFADRLR